MKEFEEDKDECCYNCKEFDKVSYHCMRSGYEVTRPIYSSCEHFRKLGTQPDNDATALSTQCGGDHYKKMTIQPVEFINRNKLGFCEGNVIKYVCRHRAKNGKEDLLKARHYIDLLIEMEYPP